MKLSIIAKLAALSVSIVLLTTFAVSEIYLQGSTRILTDEAIAALKNETRFIKYPLDGLINQLRDDTRLLAHSPAHTQLADMMHSNAETMLHTRTYYRTICLYDAHGKRIFAAKKQTNGDSEIDDGIQHLLSQAPQQKDTVTFSELTRTSSSDATMLLDAAAPLIDGSGFVAIRMDLGKALVDLKEQIITHRRLYITDDKGNYLLHPDKSELIGDIAGHHSRIQDDYPNILSAMRDTTLNEAAFVSDSTRSANAIAFLEDHYDAQHPERYIGIAVETPYHDILSKTEVMERRGIIFGSAIAASAILLALLLLRRLLRPLSRIADAVVRYRQGEKNIALPVDSPDEIGVLAKEFQAMMRQKDDEDWIKETLVNMSGRLLGITRLDEFCQTLLDDLAECMNAQIGVIYIHSRIARELDNDNEAAPFDGLKLVAAYGYPHLQSPAKQFCLRDGLVGSCAEERKMKLLYEIPADYAQITSGTGASSPKMLLLLPLLFESTTLGVIELAALQPFSTIQQRFLTQLAFTIGVLINSISAGMRTEELLESSRRTAEELRKSEEELRVQQEELQVSNEEMEEKARALEEQNQRIRQQSDALIENQRQLERANQYKSEFLANMSHELRTPLNSLLILARGLSDNEEGNLTAEQVEEAQIIHNGGLELLGLINDILDLSKVEAGKISVQRDNYSITKNIEKLKRQFEPLARDKQLGFTVTIADDVPDMLHTDGQRFEQIIKNLLGNAFKFTPRGSVTLDVKPSDARNGFVAFSVKDTGIGIEASKLKDIFEAFQQEDGSTDRHYGGTGLGLTISRKFAWLLGGEIRVESQKNSGSIFTLLLPVHTSIPQSPAAPLPNMPRSHEKRLLIIEDDQQFSAILSKIAQARGYEVICANDGATGLQLSHQEHVNAIILDLSLPDKDGLDVLAQLKAHPKTASIPVHIISGRAAQDVSNHGAAGYVNKPASPEAIDNILAQIEQALPKQLRQLLVVEDDRNTQIAIQRLFKKRNVSITMSDNGLQALAHYQDNTFDCIILDLALPDMSGFEWLEAAERQTGDDHLPPIIVYTARELSEDEYRRLARHTSSVVIKGGNSPDRLLDEVTLFLHSLEPARVSTVQTAHPDKRLSNKTLLLVDDDLRNVFALSKVLKKQGLQVLVADNGEMALSMLRQHPAIDLIMMDIMMPVMDGYQAISEIRRHEEWRQLPIIALTARAMPEEQEKCLACGANDYLSKPVDIDQLLSLLRVLLFKQEKN